MLAKLKYVAAAVQLRANGPACGSQLYLRSPQAFFASSFGVPFVSPQMYQLG